MTNAFTPRLDILPLPQRRLWDELSEMPAAFVLYGGTAIALHLGHRESLDFDFFGNLPLDPTQLTLGIPFLASATVTQREPNTLSCIVDRGGAVKLLYFQDGNVRQLPADMKDRLAGAARKVDLDKLPVIRVPDAPSDPARPTT